MLTNATDAMHEAVTTGPHRGVVFTTPGGRELVVTSRSWDRTSVRDRFTGRHLGEIHPASVKWSGGLRSPSLVAGAWSIAQAFTTEGDALEYLARIWDADQECEAV